MRRTIALTLATIGLWLNLGGPNARAADYIAPPASVLSSQGIDPPTGWVDLEETFEYQESAVIGPEIPPMQQSNSSNNGGGPNCQGCRGVIVFRSHDHWWSEHVWTPHHHAHMDEAIEGVNQDGSLKSSGNNRCNDPQAQVHWADSQSQSPANGIPAMASNIHQYQKNSDMWRLDSTFDFLDDGFHWLAQPGICRQF